MVAFAGAGAELVVGAFVVTGVVVEPVVVAVNAAPAATDKVTTEPFATFPPAFGSSSTTVPTGFVDVTGARAARKPRLSNLALAVSKDRPVTTGTATPDADGGLVEDARVSTTVVVLPASRCVKK
jgi:hypothetical protein